MKKVWLLGIILFSSTLVSQTFTNGDFENWTSGSPDGWTLTPEGTRLSFSQSANNDGRSGTGYALVITANSNASSYDGQMEAWVEDIVAGDDYRISIWTKSNGGQNNVWIRFWDTRWFDSGDNQVGSDHDQNDYSSGDNISWKEYTTPILTAPTGATKLRVNFRVYIQTSFNPGDFVWIDDLSANGTVLPVELTSFTASVVNNSVMLNWRTETEVDNYGFEVQRSEVRDQKSNEWEKIGFVNGSGNSNSPKNYTFRDDLSLTPDLNRTLNYRLKQIDTDGDYEYSDVIEVDLGMPNEFELAQNFPNPFNPVTKISWQSPIGSRQTLKVYDILGNEVATLVNEYKPAGSYEVEFDGKGLSSGMYFYQLKTENFTTVKKMILSK